MTPVFLFQFFQDFFDLAACRPLGFHFGIVVKKAFIASVLVVEKVFVAPFEIENHGDGRANQPRFEKGIARVHGKTLHARNTVMFDLLPHVIPFFDKVSLVVEGPVPGTVDQMNVELAAFESLAHGDRVQIYFPGEAGVIVASPVDGKGPGPPVQISL